MSGTILSHLVLSSNQVTRLYLSVQFITPSPLTKTDTKGYFCTTAHRPDLFVNAQNAVRYLLDWLEAEHGFARSQAYCPCSAAADLMKVKN